MILKSAKICPKRRQRQKGIALIIVLAFVALLAVVVLAFFSRVTTESSIAGSSSSLIKADLLARSGLDIVVNDLKREMVSKSDVVNDDDGNFIYYTPKTALDVIPSRSGNPTGSPDPIPNLIRRSYSADSALPFPSKASPVNSTDVSANGRSVSPARWNASYLIPMTSATDNTPSPAASFTAPDWVLVNRKGPVAATTFSSTLSDGSASNTNFVVGRYAYAIYDEGGLLDMNVAGYPAASTQDQSGRKNAVAYADLTQLPPLASLSSSEQTKIVNNLVGWRNFASVQPGGTFPNFSINTAGANRYFDFITGNTNGFLTVFSGGVNGPTDQAVLTRQQLIQLVRGLGASQEVLQYMGTFSRDLDQPSFSPSASLPKIRSGSGVDALGNLRASDNINFYGTGNDAYSYDRYGTTPAELAQKSPYDINPPFLSVRVENSFTRADGSTAVEGEPLLKKRFPLSRLALLTKTATASKSSTDPIYKYFGLYRSSASDPWTYDHGVDSGILRLSYKKKGGADPVPSGVAQQTPGREPDFIELLKSAVNVGSLAKGVNPATTRPYLFAQHAQDILTALQTLQIAANIIDQYDADSYPTRIQIKASDGSTKEVAGVEDLPYIYQMRDRPAFVSTNLGRFFIQPVVWNPHDPASGTPSSAPTEFRIRPESVDPASVMDFAVGYNRSPSVNLSPDWDNPIPSYGPVTFKAGESQGFFGFRQPTLLGEENVPSGSEAKGNGLAQQFVTSIDSGTKVIGIVAIDYVLQVPATAPYSPPTLSFCNGIRATGPTAGVNFILEYKDGGQWIPYNSFVYYEETNSHSVGVFFSTTANNAQGQIAIDANYRNVNPIKAVDKGSDTNTTRWWGGARLDPRYSRWSTYTFQYANLPKNLSYSQNTYSTMRAGTEISLSCHHATPSDKAMIGSSTSGYAGKTWVRGFQYAYWTENSVRATQQDAGQSTELRRFTRDADGIVRRAMAGYATDTANGGSLTELNGLPMADNNFASRPLILNRPFRSVGELGHVSRGDNWKNLSFSFPESGDAALLDVFCLEDSTRSDGLIAGRVNLNSRQAPVLQAVLAGANVEPSDPANVLTGVMAKDLSEALVARTSATYPVNSRAELVGKWIPGKTLNSTDVDPQFYYTGFSSDIGTVNSLKGKPEGLITRKREATIRALNECGTARTWNLLIDIVAQSGRYTGGAKNLNDFMVEGEKRYWLHIAIDRATGDILDQQLEPVSE